MSTLKSEFESTIQTENIMDVEVFTKEALKIPGVFAM